MRLFIAINFSEEVKNAVMAASDVLRAASWQGTFVRREAMHLTLEFLGETEPSRLPEIKAAMDAAAGKSFDVSLSGTGVFKRDGGDIWWVGVRPSAELTALEGRLRRALAEAGFKTETRPFRPHITLARRVVLKRDADRGKLEKCFGTASFTAGEICLMQSDLRPSGPVYTKLYGKELF